MKRKCCCVKSTVTCLWIFRKEFDGRKKEELNGLSTTDLTTGIQHFLQTFLCCLPLDRSFICLEDGGPDARASQQPRNAAVLKHSRSRTSKGKGDSGDGPYTSRISHTSSIVCETGSFSLAKWQMSSEEKKQSV